jgi:glucose/arabinose dehydrogenase
VNVQMKVRMTRLLPVVAVSLLTLLGCGSEPVPEPETAPETSVGPSEPLPTKRPDVTVLARKLKAPWSITFHRDAPLISERDSARILELDAQGRTRVVATIGGVQAQNEGGLLGITAHGGFLYAYSTSASGNRIQRFAITGEAGKLGLGKAETVLSGIPSSDFHNGGRIAFGPDGMLYATVGDTGDSATSQNPDSLAGKILRMTPTGDVPKDNPFPNSLVYSYGHRNPQGIAWTSDGTMYASEFGQDTWDELNVIKPGGNYGWPVVEGRAGKAQYIDPVQQWSPENASPSGIAITEDSIFIANLRGTRLREVPLAALAKSKERWVGRYGRLRDAVVAPDGSIWVLTNNTDGRGDPGPNDDRLLRFAPPS